jgi:hypothetical protein
MGLFSKKKAYSDKRGYMRFKDSDIPVHRWAAEKKLGRKLKGGEVVHHKDRNKANNSPSNLFVFRSQLEHDKAHKKDALRFGKDFSYSGRKKNSKKGF